LGVIDFGCVKLIPDSFYDVYFKLLDGDILNDTAKRDAVFEKLCFIYPDDTVQDRKFFLTIFSQLVELLSRPFRSERFDFANGDYFQELYAFGERLTSMKELRESKKARGVRDAIYINRTYFGLYSILHELKAEVTTRPAL
jgi:hypothetical protein